MKAHGWLRHVITRTGGAHRAPREPWTGTVRAWAASGILALALALGGLGIAASASPGHSGTGRAHGSTHRTASGHTVSTNTGATTSSIHKLPWMY